MTRRRLAWIGAVLAASAIAAWIASHTYWASVDLPLPLRGEARTNPFYAAQRFAEDLGARTVWDRVFVPPPPGAVVVISSWHWDLSPSRRQSLQRWVESGGRLVVDRLLAGSLEPFQRWSGISRRLVKRPEETLPPAYPEPCAIFTEYAGSSGSRGTNRYWLCGGDRFTTLIAPDAVWGLRNDDGLHVARVRVGRGSVTVINAVPFRFRGLFDGDHGRLFVAATELRRGDDVHFLSEDEHPSLLSLAWQFGAPVVLLLGILVALALWRNLPRFGPLAAPDETARRSLAEQILGTGRFTLRYGGGDALRAASIRALDEAAQRRIPRYRDLDAGGRVEALARLTGFGAAELAAAHGPAARRGKDLRHALDLLERARRTLLPADTRRTDG